MNDTQRRNITADSLAKSIIVDFLLVDYLKRNGGNRHFMAREIKDFANSSLSHELLDLDISFDPDAADIYARVDRMVDGYVSRALMRDVPL